MTCPHCGAPSFPLSRRLLLFHLLPVACSACGEPVRNALRRDLAALGLMVAAVAALVLSLPPALGEWVPYLGVPIFFALQTRLSKPEKVPHRPAREPKRRNPPRRRRRAR